MPRFSGTATENKPQRKPTSVLMLEFGFNDLALEQESEFVEATFKSLGYNVERFQIGYQIYPFKIYTNGFNPILDDIRGIVEGYVNRIVPVEETKNKSNKQQTVKETSKNERRRFAESRARREKIDGILDALKNQSDLTQVLKTYGPEYDDFIRYLQEYLKQPVNRRAETWLKSKIEAFLEHMMSNINEDRRYIIYYYGHGDILYPRNPRLGERVQVTPTLSIFSHNPPESKEEETQWDAYYQHIKESRYEHLIQPTNSKCSECTVYEENFLNFHALYQNPVITVRWEKIYKPIVDALTNILVILDCCNAGLAASTMNKMIQYGAISEYRKELIGACGWGNKTQDLMSEAMISCLNKHLGDEACMSISSTTLVTEMDNWLATKLRSKSKKNPAQAVYCLIQRVLHNPNRSTVNILPMKPKTEDLLDQNHKYKKDELMKPGTGSTKH
ncbi:hypothetical protein H072_10 [Dactylellina haptotyla CBS 200.50]|uniref:Uncharacterized protein n=1 Tax=Dactylellina haptotyla (strain CBS 200.50) TaxID=1284197 RepID=S8C2N7_DACHA|nr:hypothetical protein H072_10 [Dactylellina haptotyla CBS 200.50]